MLDGVTVLAEAVDEAVEFVQHGLAVFKAEFRPHFRLESRDACHVAETSGGDACVRHGGVAFDVGAGEDMGQLGSVGDDAVMLLRCRDCDATEAERQEERLRGGHRLDGCAAFGHENHGFSMEEIRLGRRETEAFDTRHRMAANECKSMFFS